MSKRDSTQTVSIRRLIEMRRYVIIGTSVAGIAAAQVIHQQDGNSPVILIGDDPGGYYSRPGMAYYLTGEMNENFLFPLSDDQFQELKAERIADHVTRIHTAEYRVECRSGRSFQFDRLLIATGSKAIRLPVPGIDLEGVVKLDDLEDARQIRKLARKGRTAVVVGGGIIALELVEGLLAQGVRVHLFLLGDRFWNTVLEETEAQIVEERLRKEGVEIHTHTEMMEVVGRRGKVSEVLTKDGRRFKADILAVAVGVRPAKELAVECGIKTDRGIFINPWMETSQADIYAAGDVAQVFDQASGKWVVESLWVTANSQGRAAGLNMAGLPTPYTRAPAINVTRMAGMTTALIGAIGLGGGDDLISITHGDSESWRDSPEAIVSRIDYDLNHVRIIIGEKTMIGAVVMGDQGLTPILRDLILNQVDISPIRSELMAVNAPVGDLVNRLLKHSRNDGNDAQRA